MRFATVASCLALVLALCGPHTAQAFCPKRFADSVQGVDKTVWQPAPEQAVRVAFSDTIDDTTLAAIKAAFEAWADVDCSTLSFTYLDGEGERFSLSETSYLQPESPQAEIYVFWVTAAGEPQDLVGGFDNIIAHTFPTHDQQGKLLQASIAINAKGDTYRWQVLETDDQTMFDIQTIMVALVGEIIGLTNSELTTDTVLKKGPLYAGLGEQAPLADDRDGVRFLYWDDSCSEDQRPGAPGADEYCYPSAPQLDAGIVLDGGVADAAGVDAGGKCTSTDQCAQGQICTAEGECSTMNEDDGCSCAAKSNPPRALGALAPFAVLALLGLYRRRRVRR